MLRLDGWWGQKCSDKTAKQPAPNKNILWPAHLKTKATLQKKPHKQHQCVPADAEHPYHVVACVSQHVCTTAMYATLAATAAAGRGQGAILVNTHITSRRGQD